MRTRWISLAGLARSALPVALMLIPAVVAACSQGSGGAGGY